jgi:hypothetical protein
VLAAIAVTAKEPSRVVAATDIALEGIHHVARQRRGVRGFGVRDEAREMLAHEAMQHAVLRAARRIRGGDATHAGAFAVRTGRAGVIRSVFLGEAPRRRVAPPWRGGGPRSAEAAAV